MRKHPLFLVSAGLALLLVLLMLADCGVSKTASTQPSPSPTSSTQVSASPGASLTATPRLVGTPTIIVHGDWQTYIDPRYGFHLDVPALLSISFPAPTILPSGPDDDYISWQYDTSQGPPPSDQALFAEITVYVYATDTLRAGEPNPCTIGEHITIGSGVTAYEADNPDYPTPAPGGVAGGPGMLLVNVATGGVYMQIILNANPPTGTMRTRYGAIWQHILNSFVPGPPVPGTHPCG